MIAGAAMLIAAAGVYSADAPAQKAYTFYVLNQRPVALTAQVGANLLKQMFAQGARPSCGLI